MKRAIGIIRVSEVGGRNGDRFHSPAIQRERIERDCERYGLELLTCFEEFDVSGGRPLHKRPALGEAMELISKGLAHAIVFAYRDRVDRSIEAGSQLIEFMDLHGAMLIADGKRLTHATHDGWRTATLESFLNEDQRRAISAKMVDVHERAIAQGKAPFRPPPGYRKRDDGTTELDPDASKLIHEAWLRRAAGQSTIEIHKWLGRMGTRVSLNTVTRMFRNRFYLGELHYRRWHNLDAHPALVSGPEWEAVQAQLEAPRGRYGKSDRLLSRQELVRCAECDSRMSLAGRGTKRTGNYYRCYNPECPARAAIEATTLEVMVMDFTRDLLRDLVGRASAKDVAVKAKADLARAEEALSRLRRRLAAADDEAEAESVAMVREARKARDEAQDAYDAALAIGAVVKVDADYVFEHGTLQDCRDLIRSVIKRVRVRKAAYRGEPADDRVNIEGKTA